MQFDLQKSPLTTRKTIKVSITLSIKFLLQKLASPICQSTK